VAGTYVTVPDAGAATKVQTGHLNYRTPSGSLAEVSYGGASSIGRIHCTTCHDFNATNDPHVTGRYVAQQAPVRVPGGVGAVATLEKSPALSTAPVGTDLSYGRGNVCVFCHKSRKDVTFYVGASNALSIRWGPHDGPQSDVYSAKGGYQFAGQTYGSSAHATLADACVSCHMRPVAGNANVPDHTMKPALAYCKTCHTQYTGTSFDIQGGQSAVRDALRELETALNNAGVLTRSVGAPYVALSDEELGDNQFHLDKARPGNVLDEATAGALYDYLIVARSKDMGVHNPTYAKQLLWDSIKHVTGANPTSLPARPQ